MAINCFRYLGFSSFEQVDQLNLNEYEIMMEAFNLRQVDQEFWIHLQAFENYRAQATTTSGKHTRPVYTTFKKFFDYEAELKRVQKKQDTEPQKFSGIGNLLKKQEEK